MKNVIYSFLDKYIGEGYNVELIDEIDAMNNFKLVRVAYICSNNKTVIIKLVYVDSKPPHVEYSQELGETLCNFFSFDYVNSYVHIMNWFKEKYNLKTIMDIEDFTKYILERNKVVDTNPFLV
jgi:hypothetical protein